MPPKKTSTPDYAQSDEYIFRWHGPEFLHYHRSWKWYLIATLCALGFYYLALTEHSFPMLIVLLSVIVVFYLYDQQKPREVEIIISRIGLRIGDQFYPYSDLQSFRIEYHPPLRLLHFQSHQKIHQEISIPFPTELSPAQLREFLLTQLPEQSPEDQSLLDYLLRILRF